MTPSAPTHPQWSRIRRYVRYHTDIRVVVTIQQDGKPLPVYGRCTVVAEGGFGATLAGELCLSDAVEAELILGGDRPPLEAPAVVRNRAGFRHGFEFTGLTMMDRARLRDFCTILQPSNS